MRSSGRAAPLVSFDIRLGSAALGVNQTRSQIKCFVLCSIFPSVEVLERVSEHGYRKMAVQALAPIGVQERDRQREEEARKSEVCRDRSLGRILCHAEILNFFKPSKLHFFWELLFLIGPIPVASIYVSVQGQTLGCFSLLNGGGFKSAETRFSRRFYVAQMG